MSSIAVSIICNTYNHEAYIQKALESFVMQKTNFAFEVLIHDDASTDKTADIIREYEEKYPDIIKPIYQTENQYSKGVNISNVYQYSRAKGKYFAFCEGDDYWIDPCKLQKQFDAMEQHPELDMCAHAAICVDAQSRKQTSVISPKSQDSILTVEEVIKGEGGYVATNSLLYRRVIGLEIPRFRAYLPLDYTMQIQGSLRGGMLYLKESMSAYRVFVPGSWTVRTRLDPQKRKAFYEKRKQMLLFLDEDTNYAYSDVIRDRILENEFLEILDLNCNKSLLSKKYRPFFKARSPKEQLKIRIKILFPFLVSIKRSVWKLKHK